MDSRIQEHNLPRHWMYRGANCVSRFFEFLVTLLGDTPKSATLYQSSLFPNFMGYLARLVTPNFPYIDSNFLLLSKPSATYDALKSTAHESVVDYTFLGLLRMPILQNSYYYCVDWVDFLFIKNFMGGLKTNAFLFQPGATCTHECFPFPFPFLHPTLYRPFTMNCGRGRGFGYFLTRCKLPTRWRNRMIRFVARGLLRRPNENSPLNHLRGY